MEASKAGCPGHHHHNRRLEAECSLAGAAAGAWACQVQQLRYPGVRTWTMSTAQGCPGTAARWLLGGAMSWGRPSRFRALRSRYTAINWLRVYTYSGVYLPRGALAPGLGEAGAAAGEGLGRLGDPQSSGGDPTGKGGPAQRRVLCDRERTHGLGASSGCPRAWAANQPGEVCGVPDCKAVTRM